MSAMIDGTLVERNLDLRIQSAHTLLEEGDLQGAGEIYQTLVDVPRTRVGALNGLALVALHAGNPAHALVCLDEALKADPKAAATHITRGHALRRLNRLAPAAAAFRQACKFAPQAIDPMIALAQTLSQLGVTDEAERVLRRGIKSMPQDLALRAELAAQLLQRRQWKAAELEAERMLALDPDCAAAHCVLGQLASSRGDAERARSCYEVALRTAPGHAPAWLGLGELMLHSQQQDAAVQCLQRAIQADPGQATAWFELGRLLADTQRAEAIHCLEQGLGIDAHVPEALLLLAKLLILDERHADAVSCTLRALELAPRDAYGHYLCATSLRGVRMVEGSIDHCRQALALRPAPNVANGTLYVLALNCMETGRTREALQTARALIERGVGVDTETSNPYELLARLHALVGDARAALEAYQRVVDAAPKALLPRANLCMASTYADHLDAAELLRLRRETMRPLAALPKPLDHANLPDPDRRLRVGYLSGDFREHSCAHFLEPLLFAHDRDAFELVAYSTVAVEDAVTARLKPCFDTWRDVRTVAAQALAEQVRSDGIDILVDLAWVTEGGRPTAVARKPAPVQIEWLGFLGSTGIAALDYRLTDAWVDPPGSEPLAVEAPLRLDSCYLCYQPPLPSPAVGPLPMLTRGHPVFGSFNNLAKLSDATVALWCAVLQAVPQARLMLKALVLADPWVRERTLERFARQGIAAERLDLHARTDAKDHHLALYGEVDVALDTFPYNGVTTTCEAAWMGVPVVSLHSETLASRQGLSLLQTLGLGSLAVDTPQAYVDTCVRLVADAPALAGLRAGLRATMQASPLMDGPGFARRTEAAYRQAWQAWCARATSARQEPA